MTESNDPELLTFAQAALRLGVGVLTIRAWVRTEQCPVVRDGPAGVDLLPGGLTPRQGGCDERRPQHRGDRARAVTTRALVALGRGLGVFALVVLVEGRANATQHNEGRHHRHQDRRTEH